MHPPAAAAPASSLLQARMEHQARTKGGGNEAGASGNDTVGADALASFMLDRGVDPSAAIIAAQNLVSVGLSSLSDLPTMDPARLRRASGLSDDDLHRIMAPQRDASKGTEVQLSAQTSMMQIPKKGPFIQAPLAKRRSVAL